MLDIRPFEYGLIMVAVYDEGSTSDASIIDTTDEVILSKFLVGIGNVASLSLGVNFPTVASFPHVVLNGYKNILSIALGTSYTFEGAELIKQMAENPGAYVSSAPSQSSATPSQNTSSAPEPEPEPEEEDEGLEFDLFG